MGANVSVAESEVDNTIKGAVTTMMEQKADGSINLACSNNQTVRGASGCDIEFADQLCEAVGISNFAGSQQQMTDVSQDVMNEVVAGATAAASGFTIGANVSSSSTFVKNMVDMSMDITNSFSTNCTRNIQAINNQSVEDCSSGTVVKFKPQTISAKVIGDCVVNQVGSQTAAMKITNAITATSDAASTGIDLTALAIIGIIFLFLLMLGGPKAVQMMSEAAFGRGETGAQTRRMAYYSMAVMSTLILLLLFWWPGLPGASGGSSYGVWPHQPQWVTDANEDDGCFKGELMGDDMFINKFMWYDPHCLAANIGQSGDTACKESDKTNYYRGCGLFSDSPGCNDPTFVQDRDRYFDIVKACGDPALVDKNVAFCDAASYAAKLFIESEENAYIGCKRCNEGPIRGMYVSDGAVCSTDSIDLYDYVRSLNPDANGIIAPCDPQDPHCKDTVAILQRTSPGDCMDTAYQMHKKVFSHALSACDKVDSLAVVNKASNGGAVPPFAEQCSPDIFAYMTQCNAVNNKCTYRATGNDPRVVGACTNNLESCCYENEAGERVCDDPDYQLDLAAFEQRQGICAAKWEALQGFEYAPHLSAFFYIILLLSVVFMWMRQDPAVQQRAATGVAGVFSTTGVVAKNFTLFYAMVFMAIIAGIGFPFGLLAMVHHDWPVSLYNEDTRPDLGQSGEAMGAYFWVGWITLGLALLGLAYNLYRYVFFTQVTTTVQDAPQASRRRSTARRKNSQTGDGTK